jgi:uncharacterized protein
MKTRRPGSLLHRSIGLLLFLALIGVTAFTVADPWWTFEKVALNPGFRSNATPGDLGVPFQRVHIDSGSRQLDGFFVPAPARCDKPVAVLIYHGRGETIAGWGAAQKRLREACIASLAFDYSGHGRSDGPGTIANLNSDALAAYETFTRLTPTSRHCLLSHSMGAGPMLWAATSSAATAAPDCIVVASPFSSLRAMAERSGMPRSLAALMPDVWDNVSQVKHIRAPLLWIHSRADQTIPVAEGQAVFDAAPGPRKALILDGYGHSAIYQQLPEAIWAPMTAFIRG